MGWIHVVQLLSDEVMLVVHKGVQVDITQVYKKPKYHVICPYFLQYADCLASVKPLMLIGPDHLPFLYSHPQDTVLHEAFSLQLQRGCTM